MIGYGSADLRSSFSDEERVVIDRALEMTGAEDPRGLVLNSLLRRVEGTMSERTAHVPASHTRSMYHPSLVLHIEKIGHDQYEFEIRPNPISIAQGLVYGGYLSDGGVEFDLVSNFMGAVTFFHENLTGRNVIPCSIEDALKYQRQHIERLSDRGDISSARAKQCIDFPFGNVVVKADYIKDLRQNQLSSWTSNVSLWSSVRAVKRAALHNSDQVFDKGLYSFCGDSVIAEKFDHPTFTYLNGPRSWMSSDALQYSISSPYSYRYTNDPKESGLVHPNHVPVDPTGGSVPSGAIFNTDPFVTIHHQGTRWPGEVRAFPTNVGGPLFSLFQFCCLTRAGNRTVNLSFSHHTKLSIGETFSQFAYGWETDLGEWNVPHGHAKRLDSKLKALAAKEVELCRPLPIRSKGASASVIIPSFDFTQGPMVLSGVEAQELLAWLESAYFPQFFSPGSNHLKWVDIGDLYQKKSILSGMYVDGFIDAAPGIVDEIREASEKHLNKVLIRQGPAPGLAEFRMGTRASTKMKNGLSIGDHKLGAGSIIPFFTKADTFQGVAEIGTLMEGLDPDNSLVDVEFEQESIRLSGELAGIGPDPDDEILRPYQSITKNVHIQSKGFLNALTMGLGKTVVTLCAQRELAQTITPWRSIVVCSPLLRSQWAAEAERFFPEATVRICTKMSDIGKLRDWDEEADSSPLMIIISPPFLSKYGTEIAQQGFDISEVVIDECSFLKNPRSKQSKAAWDLREMTPRAIGLTGTPIETKVADLFHCLSWTMGSKDVVDPDYLKLIQKAIKDDPILGIQMTVDAAGPYIVRFDRSEISDELPDIHTQVVRLHGTTAEQALADACQFEVSRMLQSFMDDAGEILSDEDMTKLEKVTRGSALGAITIGRQAASDPKAINLESSSLLVKLLEQNSLISKAQASTSTKAEWLKGTIELAEDAKFVIFTEFVSVAESLVEMLEAHGISVTQVVGAQSASTRDAEVARFTEGDASVMIMSKVGERGLNLQAATDIVLYDLPWNPARILQRVGRSVRIGNDKPMVNVWIPIMIDTAEEVLVDKILPPALFSAAVLDISRGVEIEDTEMGQVLMGLGGIGHEFISEEEEMNELMLARQVFA